MARNNIMDQIANMVNMVKNGGRASHEFVTVPFSKIKYASSFMINSRHKIPNSR